MSHEITSPQPGPRSGAGPYVVAWVALGLAALGYLAALVVRPDLVTEHLPVLQPGEPETNQGQRAMSKALAEVRALKDSVAQVQLDVSRLKAEQAGSDDRQKVLSSRLATVEEKLTVTLPPVASAGQGQPRLGQAASAAPSAASASASAAAEPAPAKSSPGASKSAAVPSEPSKGKDAVAAALKGADALGGLPAALDATRPGIETGSLAAAAPAAAIPRVINARPQPAAEAEAAGAATAAARAAPQPGSATAAQPVATFGPAVVKPAPQPMGLRISTGPSLDALRLSWSLLSDRHTSQLKTLEPRYVARDGASAAGEAGYDLIAGPVKSEAEAKRICKALAAKSVPCEVGAFGGNAL